MTFCIQKVNESYSSTKCTIDSCRSFQLHPLKNVLTFLKYALLLDMTSSSNFGLKLVDLIIVGFDRYGHTDTNTNMVITINSKPTLILPSKSD